VRHCVTTGKAPRHGQTPAARGVTLTAKKRGPRREIQQPGRPGTARGRRARQPARIGSVSALNICCIADAGSYIDLVSSGNAMLQGGRRPSVGRPKGSSLGGMRRSLRAATRKRLIEVIEAGADPLSFMIDVLADKGVDLETRLHVAEVLLPYCHPRQCGCPPQVEADAQHSAKTRAIIAVPVEESQIA